MVRAARRRAAVGCAGPSAAAHALARAHGESLGTRLIAGYPHMYALTALAITDELNLAERRLAEAAEHAERHGSLVGSGIARFTLARVRMRAGSLDAAERDVRHAIEAAQRTAEEWLVAIAVATLADVLIERGELAAAQAVIDAGRARTRPGEAL